MTGKRAGTLLELMDPNPRAGSGPGDHDRLAVLAHRVDAGPSVRYRFPGRDACHGQRLAIGRAGDGQLEVTTAGYTYAAEPPGGGVCVAGPPGPARPATRFIAGTLAEVGHHGAQIGALRDFYAWRQIDRR